MKGHVGKHQGQSGGRRIRMGRKSLLWFLWEGLYNVRKAGLVLSSLNNFKKLQEIGTATCCPNLFLE